MYIIGKIRSDIYKCISENIEEDEVIITDERITHIRERHPDDFDKYCSYISVVIDEPDYIIKANRPNTAVLLKEICEKGEKFKLVLRLKVTSDPENYKNSVLSFWKIGDVTWKKNLKNKTILYKKE